MSAASLRKFDCSDLIASDPYLEPFKPAIQARYAQAQSYLDRIEAHGGGLDAFTKGYEFYGFNRVNDAGKKGIVYREWAPNATAAALVGDFNGWNTTAHPMRRDEYGTFMIFLPDAPDGKPVIPHNTFVKIVLTLPSGEQVYRLPAWSKYACFVPEHREYCAKHWDPAVEDKHVWTHQRPKIVLDSGNEPRNFASETFPRPAGQSEPAVTFRHSLRIYEAHVGMATSEERVGTYREFADYVLPRVKRLGYNCVQLMAIMEHAYYGSFGYHVTNFFAVSSRFGTPEDLKYLVDTAHSMGLLIIMDMVQSHASKNVNDGLNLFDGTEYQYFHGGAKGNHDLWDSKLFDYGKFEVQRFLLSNVRWFVEEYRFDGYRFDGVTSMLYTHHGIGTGFSGGYHEYFNESVDVDAAVHMMLANLVLHSLPDPALSIAEDVSGMPGLCKPVWTGGIGFDYRLAMAIPDKWIQLLKEFPDDKWDMGNLVFTLTNRRYQELTITYAESHDQALVGDKTLAFWLMDKEMYTHMSKLSHRTLVIDRGMALHKMIRLITYGLGGEAYLNFMGNEFGHPEWIDFPREGNGWSYKHCRRQWNIVDDDLLRYSFLNAFDAEMHRVEEKYSWLVARDTFVSLKHETDKMIVFDKAGLVFVFNFHPTNSFTDYRVGAPRPGKYRIVLDSDWSEFDGHQRNNRDVDYFTTPDPWHDRPCYLSVYSPSRTVLVFAKVD